MVSLYRDRHNVAPELAMRMKRYLRWRQIMGLLVNEYDYNVTVLKLLFEDLGHPLIKEIRSCHRLARPQC